MLNKMMLAMAVLWLGGCTVAPTSTVEPPLRGPGGYPGHEQARTGDPRAYPYPDDSRNHADGRSSAPTAWVPPTPAPESVRRAPVVATYSENSTGVSAADALLRQGKAYHEQGQYANAANNFERGIRIAPRSPALYLALARTRLALNEYNSAVQMANRALSLLPREGWGVSDARADAWGIIADSKAAAGDRKGAEAARTRAREYW